MTSDQSANRTQGETEGIDQEPTDVGDSDTTQQKQAAKEDRQENDLTDEQTDADDRDD